MVFGRKKIAEPKVEEIAEVETPDLEVDLNQEEEPVEEIVEPVKKAKPQPVKKVIAQAQIINGELLDGGVHRYVVVTNKALGEIGQKFDLD